MVTHHTSSKPPCHQRESNKQEQSSSPDSSRVPETFFPPDSVFINEVDDKVPKESADARNPVDERDVHRRITARWGVVRRLGVLGKDGSV
jgi:hypothetical protein